MHCPNCGFAPSDFHAALSLMVPRLQQEGRITYRFPQRPLKPSRGSSKPSRSQVLQVCTPVLNLIDQEPLAGHPWIVEEYQVRIRGTREKT